MKISFQTHTRYIFRTFLLTFLRQGNLAIEFLAGKTAIEVFCRISSNAQLTFWMNNT